ncbi:putative wall-associated receptor kinase, galacturonan-binding domain-containing protein [Rosa chinensis]|uniref:RING-type E3 ubiquitin transferase n=1 Tax=Rosa chinensis TaxID=74649 RepID=A0A2P6P660_ROSCH|nr:putative wall-associated receptor kinase, galacturonan-binding domain-containing protein [Rosa chinensis]
MPLSLARQSSQTGSLALQLHRTLSLFHMPPLHIFFSFSLFFLFPQIARAASADCSISSCPNGPPVRFPFRLRRKQRLFCGYRGFDLSCNNQTLLTTLTLPGSGAFLVQRIDYKSQKLWINDPNSCLPKRLLSHPFSFYDTPFSVVGGSKNYTFLNCSSSQTTSTLPATATSISCLSGGGTWSMLFPRVHTMLLHRQRHRHLRRHRNYVR